MIPGTGATCGLCIMTKGGAYTGDFISGNGSSSPGPAANNTFICLLCGYGLSDLATGERPVNFWIVFCQRTKGLDLVAAPLQLLNHNIGQMCAFITSNRNSHAALLVPMGTYSIHYVHSATSKSRGFSPH